MSIKKVTYKLLNPAKSLKGLLVVFIMFYALGKPLMPLIVPVLDAKTEIIQLFDFGDSSENEIQESILEIDFENCEQFTSNIHLLDFGKSHGLTHIAQHQHALKYYKEIPTPPPNL